LRDLDTIWLIEFLTSISQSTSRLILLGTESLFGKYGMLRQIVEALRISYINYNSFIWLFH
jgi:hypothetical protein